MIVKMSHDTGCCVFIHLCRGLTKSTPSNRLVHGNRACWETSGGWNTCRRATRPRPAHIHLEQRQRVCVGTSECACVCLCVCQTSPTNMAPVPSCRSKVSGSLRKSPRNRTDKRKCRRLLSLLLITYELTNLKHN